MWRQRFPILSLCISSSLHFSSSSPCWRERRAIPKMARFFSKWASTKLVVVNVGFDWSSSTGEREKGKENKRETTHVSLFQVEFEFLVRVVPRCWRRRRRRRRRITHGRHLFSSTIFLFLIWFVFPQTFGRFRFRLCVCDYSAVPQ